MCSSEGWHQGFPEVEPCQPEENSVVPDHFTQIYTLFELGNF